MIILSTWVKFVPYKFQRDLSPFHINNITLILVHLIIRFHCIDPPSLTMHFSWCYHCKGLFLDIYQATSPGACPNHYLIVSCQCLTLIIDAFCFLSSQCPTLEEGKNSLSCVFMLLVSKKSTYTYIKALSSFP